AHPGLAARDLHSSVGESRGQALDRVIRVKSAGRGLDVIRGLAGAERIGDRRLRGQGKAREGASGRLRAMAGGGRNRDVARDERVRDRQAERQREGGGEERPVDESRPRLQRRSARPRAVAPAAARIAWSKHAALLLRDLSPYLTAAAVPRPAPGSARKLYSLRDLDWPGAPPAARRVGPARARAPSPAARSVPSARVSPPGASSGRRGRSRGAVDA